MAPRDDAAALARHLRDGPVSDDCREAPWLVYVTGRSAQWIDHELLAGMNRKRLPTESARIPSPWLCRRCEKCEATRAGDRRPI